MVKEKQNLDDYMKKSSAKKDINWADYHLESEYEYKDKEGNALWYKRKYRHKDGKKKTLLSGCYEGKTWKSGLDKDVDKPLYRLPELIASKEKNNFILEGEKDTDNLRAWGYTAVCSPFGAKYWDKEYNSLFIGKEVFLIPDNDKDGQFFTQKIGKNLIKVASSVRVLKLPDAKDFSEWKDRNNTEEKFLVLLSEAEKWKPEDKEEEPTKEERIEIRTGKEFNPRPYSEYILENYSLKYNKATGFWWYDKTTGIWQEEFESYLKNILRKNLLKKKDLKANRVNEITEDLKGLCYIKNIPSEPSADLIPFKNKIYDLRNGKTLDFDPKYFFINKLAVNYNPENEECPSIDKLFREIVPAEDMITLYELVAYCFYRDYPYPKAFMLYGNGANGKSTFTNVLAKVLGKENVSSVSLETIQSSPFGTSELYGKLANITPEMGYGVVRDTQTLKTITGKDIIRNEEKFKKTSHFVNYAKMIFLGNEIPYSKDKSFAFFRRIFLLEFPNRFEIKLKADPFVVDKIPEQEFEGLASTCLKILKDFTTEERLFVFTHHKKTDDVREEYEKLSDPLGNFLTCFCKNDADGDIPVRAFYDEFKKYQKHEKIREWNEKKIGSIMAQKGFVKRTLRLSTSIQGDYKTYKAYLELKWKD